MNAVRRGYLYLASGAALAATVGALIALLRNLLTPGADPSLEALATQIGTLLVSVPLYLVHWRWIQRGVDAGSERASIVRQIYLYVAMAAALAAGVAIAYDLISGLLTLALGVPLQDYRFGSASQGAALVVHDGLALLILALLWAYHQRVAARDAAASEHAAVSQEAAGAGLIPRLYAYGFSGAGLIMTSLAMAGLLRWLLILLGSSAGLARAQIAYEVARLAVGLVLWLAYWLQVQRATVAPESDERVSTPRRVYLYTTLLVSILGTVATLASILASLLDRLIARRLPVGASESGGDFRQALSAVVVLAMVWGYHAWVLRQDTGGADAGGAEADAAGESDSGCVWVARLYHYLVASAGLGAILAGLAGILSVLIRALAGVPGPGLARQAADSVAALVAGLPVWVVSWRQAQGEADLPGPAGDDASQSTIRKVYLYGFLFFATITVLGSGVYVTSRLVGLLLGVERQGNLLAEIAQALGYALIAVGAWVYHGALLRVDGRRGREAVARRVESLSVVLVDPANGALGQAFLGEVQRALPGLRVTAIGADALAARVPAVAEGQAAPELDLTADLAAADVIVAPWTAVAAAAAAGAEGDAGAAIARGMVLSTGVKLILPETREGWRFLGAEELTPQAAARQAVQAIQAIAGGGGLVRSRPSGLAIAGIVLGVLLLLQVLVPLLTMLLRFD